MRVKLQFLVLQILNSTHRCGGGSIMLGDDFFILCQIPVITDQLKYIRIILCYLIEDEVKTTIVKVNLSFTHYFYFEFEIFRNGTKTEIITAPQPG